MESPEPEETLCIFAASDHAVGLLASLRQDSACQRTDYGSFAAMGSKRDGILENYGEKSEDIRLLHSPCFLGK